MNYFEVRQRLDVLRKFQKLYKDYISFTNRSDNPAAQLLLGKMRPLVPMTIDSLKHVGIGTIITHDAPARGRKKYKINMIKAIFRESLIQHFHLDENAPLEAIEAALVKYQVLISRARLQLFNPVFWLVLFIGYAANSPFILLAQCGFEIDDIRKSPVGRLIKLLIMLILIILIAEATGIRGWLAETYYRLR